MAFYRMLGQAPIDRVQAVLTFWWCEADLDADPEQDRIIAAARTSTLPTVTVPTSYACAENGAESCEVRDTDPGDL
ncbi:hypothetical protein ABZ326_06060 [Streptomyces californicus]|uniref:hypothetical protein n=1 Tax=Streptomyces californicus TaxID=67351 RepID=UPI0034D979B9